MQYWKDIDAPRLIINLAINATTSNSSTFCCEDYKSAVQDSAFVESSISGLSSLDCIAEVFTPPAVLNPLSVSIQKSGKKRLILDLRHVNQYLFKSKFRCEDNYCKGSAERWGFHVFLCFEIRLPPRRDFSRA